MSLARTIANWIVSLALITALAFAPAASAFAACMPGGGDMKMATTDSKPPCDVPCKDCSSDAAKKLCKGECVCVKTMITATVSNRSAAIPAPRLDPTDVNALLAPAHPPDIPPPRTLLA